DAAHYALSQRATFRGKRGRHVNLFAGLMRTPTGERLSYLHRRDRPSVVWPAALKGVSGADQTVFNADALEGALLSQLAEIRAEDVFPTSDAGRKVDALEERLKEVKSLERQWTGHMDNPLLVDTVASKLAELATQKRTLTEELR